MKKMTYILPLTAGIASTQVEFVETRAIANNPKANQGILVNPQDWARQDLSIRGSSDTRPGISINGRNLKASCSPHFKSGVSLIENPLSAPVARTGLDNISGHLAGTAAYTTALQIPPLLIFNDEFKAAVYALQQTSEEFC